jgi:hypothetical protein
MAKRTDVGGGRGSATTTPMTPDPLTSGASFNPGTNVGSGVNPPLLEEHQGVAQQAKEEARHLADQAKDQVKQAAGQARDHVQELVGQQKDQAANKLGTLAGALREAAHKLNEGDQSGDFGRYADQAAQQVDKLSTYLRDNDLGGFVRDTENFARRRPDLFLGTTFIAGLMLARFLKASSSSPDTGYDGYDRQDWRRYDRTTGTGYGTSYGTGPTLGTSTYGAGDRSSYAPERRDPEEGLANAGTTPFNEPIGR